MKALANNRLIITDGTIESLKWAALFLMTLAHINKYLFQDKLPVIFELGRLAMPLFGFVLAYNLARPSAMQNGLYTRTIKRLVIFGLLASPFYVILGGRSIAFGFWPLNIMFMLLLAVGMFYFIEKHKYLYASLLFLAGGAFVEFWWFALAFCLAAWWYCKSPGKIALAVWFAAAASLYVVNHNFWALAALPVIFAASHIELRMPRFRYIFYLYYPVHLAILLAMSCLIK